MACLVLAEAAHLPLEALVQQSALVARVRILETRPLGPEECCDYRSEARAEVLEAFRGARPGEVVRLRFDNGAACPNVHYAAGEECLLFAEEVRERNLKKEKSLPVPMEVTLVLETDGSVREKSRKAFEGLPTLRLEPGEACEASVDLADALPGLGGKRSLRAWASVGGRLSSPVSLEADLGDPRPQRLIELEPGQPFVVDAAASRGPFRKVGPLDDLLRFARENALLLGLFAGALALAFLSRLRPGERRTGGQDSRAFFS